MLKKIPILGLLLCFCLNFSQETKPIAKKIVELHSKVKQFDTYDLFQVNNNSDKKLEYKRSATDISVLSLNSSELKKIIKNRPEYLELSFPFQGDKKITVELIKNNIFTNDFTVKTNKGTVENYSPGVYYHGIVKGDTSSLVAFSFFEDDVVGVASTNELGNVILGKVKNSTDFVSYSEGTLTGLNPFICGIDELKENQTQKISHKPDTAQRLMTSNCVRVYYEICYAPFVNNGSNTTTTTNWITAIHNNIATLYTNDDIKTALSEIFIWQTQDPYNGTYSANLSSFRTNRPVFNGDLGHLVNSPSTTSVAYLNSLCTGNRYAYSGISQTYNNVPVYSWTIMAMTHEMGHGLGSPHTHACAWNGNGTAIDGCGPQSGNNEGCTGPIPSTTQKGTIMSYCHLVSGVGINFNNGFGPQPAALIRNTVDGKACLGTNCVTTCATTITGLLVNNVTQNSASATLSDATSTSWKYRIATLDGASIVTGTTNTQAFNLSNLQPATYYRLSVGTDCSGPLAYQRSQVFLTDANWCSGALFTDSGSQTANYSNSETLTKTFYPTAGTNLTLTFTDFSLEEDYDFLYIYNGPSATTASLFPNGTLTGYAIPGSFTSTHPTGAITVRFVSDPGVVDRGWVANFSCNILGIEENSTKDNTISVFPNPAKNNVTISSKESIKAYKIFDEAGRLVKSESSLNTDKKEINITSLLIGNYIISVETKTQTVSKKLIKK